jgi:hypothetical protein
LGFILKNNLELVKIGGNLMTLKKTGLENLVFWHHLKNKLYFFQTRNEVLMDNIFQYEYHATFKLKAKTLH